MLNGLYEAVCAPYDEHRHQLKVIKRPLREVSSQYDFVSENLGKSRNNFSGGSSNFVTRKSMLSRNLSFLARFSVFFMQYDAVQAVQALNPPILARSANSIEILKIALEVEKKFSAFTCGVF